MIQKSLPQFTVLSYPSPALPYQTLKLFSSPEQLNKMHGPCLDPDMSKPSVMQHIKDNKGNLISDCVLDDTNKLLLVLIGVIIVWWYVRNHRYFCNTHINT